MQIQRPYVGPDKAFRFAYGPTSFPLPRSLSMLLAEDADALAGKRVLVRCDFNVPRTPDGDIADDTRIRAAVNTLRALTQAGARVVVVTHWGRPDGVDDALRTAPLGARLRALLGSDVDTCDSCVGDAAAAAVDALGDGGVLMLENVRFEPGETAAANATDIDGAAADELARSLAETVRPDVYVNESVGTVHRTHASTTALPAMLTNATVPGADTKCAVVAGERMFAELSHLSRVPMRRKFALVVGGAKIDDKLSTLESVIESRKCDTIFVGGALAFSFMAARGLEVGDSLVSSHLFEQCRALQQLAYERHVDLQLPVDVVIARTRDLSDHQVVAATDMQPGWTGMDIGPRTLWLLDRAAYEHKSLFWVGPMGRYESDDAAAGDAFAAGTRGVVDMFRRYAHKATGVGGGDTLAALRHFGVDVDGAVDGSSSSSNSGDADATERAALDRRAFEFVSTAGTGALEVIGRGGRVTLPGVAAIPTASKHELRVERGYYEVLERKRSAKAVKSKAARARRLLRKRAMASA